MKLVITCVIVTILFCGCLVPFIFRAYARRSSDRISQGRRPGTVKLINRCIATLTWCNNWITIGTEQDQKRIDRLRDMLDEMLHPHG